MATSSMKEFFANAREQGKEIDAARNATLQQYGYTPQQTTAGNGYVSQADLTRQSYTPEAAAAAAASERKRELYNAAQSPYVPVSRAIEESNALGLYNAARAKVEADRYAIGDIYSNDFAAREAERQRREENQAALDSAARYLERLGMGSAVTPTLDERLRSVATAAPKSTGAGFLNAIATGYDALGTGYQKAVDALQPVSDWVTSRMDRLFPAEEEDRPNIDWSAIPDYAAQNRNAISEMQSIADRWAASSAADVERAKRGAGTLGGLLVDAGVSGLQMLGDAAINTLVPGAGLAAMGIRAAGSGAQHARQQGATLGQQLLYGGAVGGVEVLTEKMFDGVAKIYGAGAADDIVEKVVQRLARSSDGQAVLRLAASSLGEGIEEIVSGAIDPGLGSIYDGENFFSHYSKDTVADIVHDALVGAVLGGVGGTVEAVRGQPAPAAVTQTTQQTARNAPAAAPAAAQTGRAAQQVSQPFGTARTAETGATTAQMGAQDAVIGDAGVQAVNQYAREQFGAGQIGNEGTYALSAFYNETDDALTYIEQMTRTYNAGREGLGLDAAAETPELNDAQRRAAWEAGQQDAATESTAVNDDPAQHTAAEQRVIEEYKASTDNRMLNWIRRVKNALSGGDNTAVKMRLVLNPVTENTASAVFRETGVDVSDFSHMIDGSAIQHIENRHGTEGQHDHSMSDESDIARVQYVLENFDDANMIVNDDGKPKYSVQYMDKNNRPAPMIRFEKKINGTYYVVEAVPDSADKKLHITSAYMQKNSGNINQALNVDGFPSPQLTPEAPLDTVVSATSRDIPPERYADNGFTQTEGTAPADQTIPQTAPGVNTEDGWRRVEVPETQTEDGGEVVTAPPQRATQAARQGAETARGGDWVDEQRVSSDRQNTIRVDSEADLRRENERLRQRVEYWRGQTKETRRQTVREADVKRLGRRLAGDYDSVMEQGELRGRLQELGDALANEEVSYEQAREMAEDIARDLLENSQTLLSGESAELYNEIMGRLKDPMVISQQDARSISPEWGKWRDANKGKVNVSINGKGTPVDTVYSELSEAHPELFPADVTNPADMVLTMLEAAEAIEPVFGNQFSSDMSDAVEYAANDILDSIMGDEVRRTPPTFADRQAAKLASQKEKSAASLARVREQRDAAIARLKEQQRTARENARARRAESAERSKLLKILQRLTRMKTTAANRAVINEQIGDLDTVAKSMTGRTLERLSDLREWYEDQKTTNPDFIADPAIEKKLERLSKRQISDLTLDEVRDLTDVLLNIENEIRTQNKLIDSEDRRNTYLMGEEVIRDVENTRGSKPGSILDKFILTETLSPEREIRRVTGWKDNDPLRVATEGLSKGQRDMFDYQRRAGERFQKFVDDKTLMRRIAGKKAETVEVTGTGRGGESVTVEITPDMRISLYLHSLNDQNLRHIAEGGVTVPDMALYRKGDIAEAYDRGQTVKLSPSAVQTAISGMTAEERAFANEIHSYFNGMSRDAINETSEKLKGYSIADVEDYFPINTDTSFTKKDFDALKFDGTLEGMGFLKERVNAANPIMLRDASDVLLQSIKQHGKYVGLAIPVRNFNKIWGVTTASYDAEGNRNSFDSSVQQAVKRKWGEDGYKYVEKMMTDLQNNGGHVDSWDKLLNKIRSNYAGAVLTLNASVAMKQAASYPTAGAVIGFKPLARAMADFGRVDMGLINTYTPLQWYRSQGFTTQELGDLKSRGVKLPAALNWVQGVDVLTTRKLWKAAEYYVKETQPTLQKGSEAQIRAGESPFYKAVADVYNQIIEETQPNYTTMQRPQLLRSDSTLMQNLAMFKTQPFQNFNILYDAFGNLEAKRAEYRASGTAEAKAAYREAQKRAGWAVNSQIMQLAVFAGMTFAWNMFRGKDDKYTDEDGEQTVLSSLEGIGKDMLGGAASVVPFGSEAWELASSWVFGDKYYGIDAVTPSAISDFATAAQKGVKSIGELVEALRDPEAEIDWNAEAATLTDVAGDVSKIFGIPAENVLNLMKATFMQAAKATEGEYRGEYTYLRMTGAKKESLYDNLFAAYQNDREAYDDIRAAMEADGYDSDKLDDLMKKRMSKAGKGYDALYEAYSSGDTAAYRTLYGEMTGSGFFTEEQIKSNMENRMKEAAGVESVKELDQRYLSPDEQTKYDRTMNRMQRSDVWRGADQDARDMAAEALYNWAVGNDAGRKLQEKVDAGADVGLDETEYILYLVALSMADANNADPEKRNKNYDQKESAAAVEMLQGLTQEEKAYLWATPNKDWQTSKNNPYK